MKLRYLAAAAAVTLAGLAGPAQAVTEIQWWHAMGGQRGEWVASLADEFNKSQGEYKVTPVYKGTYTDTMTAAIAGFRAKQHPHIVQVFEVGTATMMAAKGAVYPVHKLMADAGEKFDPKVYLQPVIGYYSTPDGKLLSMPFNSSTPVFYYNKTAFKKAGLDPNKPPKTWPEVGDYAKKLMAAGSPCGFSTQWQTWIQLENLSAWHDVPFATKSNGMAGLDTELKFNSPLHVRHIQQFADWSKDKTFVYGGRENKPDPKFLGGECPMFMGSAGSAGGFEKGIKDTFEWGISMLPYWPDVKGAPQNSIIGGATLWVLSGHTPAEYKGVAKFFTFLSRPDVQAKSHQSTGYVPITLAAYKLTLEQGFYGKHPGFDVPVLQLENEPPTANSRGLRLGSFVQIRDIMDEELEAVWAGKKGAKQALDDAVARGNKLLRDFEKANKGAS
jgi:sn-glycerol 3-phosphate transport system substrate-binding protein